MNTATDPKVKKVLQRIAQEIKPVKIILFGSRAESRAEG